MPEIPKHFCDGRVVYRGEEIPILFNAGTEEYPHLIMVKLKSPRPGSKKTHIRRWLTNSQLRQLSFFVHEKKEFVKKIPTEKDVGKNVITYAVDDGSEEGVVRELIAILPENCHGRFICKDTETNSQWKACQYAYLQ